MNVKIVNKPAFKLVGISKEIDYNHSFAEIPKFWDEAFAEHADWLSGPIGEYGVCIDDVEKGKILYVIAGQDTGGEVPEGMSAYEFPAGEWAIFDCVGPIPKALQDVCKKVFKEWLPANADYELRRNASIEWYDCTTGEITDEDYKSALWIPVQRKGN